MHLRLSPSLHLLCARCYFSISESNGLESKFAKKKTSMFSMMCGRLTRFLHEDEYDFNDFELWDNFCYMIAMYWTIARANSNILGSWDWNGSAVECVTVKGQDQK